MNFSRIEDLIDVIDGVDITLIGQNSRIESMLKSIIDSGAPIEKSQSRIEELINAIKNHSADINTARSRIEAILYQILGIDVPIEPPQSRIEEKLLSFLEKDRPYTINVTTPPNKTIYFDGETIDFSGIVVTAYTRDGNVYGIIPFNELEFPVTIATKTPV